MVLRCSRKLAADIGNRVIYFPPTDSEPERFESLHMTLAVRGLVGLVLLFDIYTIYQQLPNPSDSSGIWATGRTLPVH